MERLIDRQLENIEKAYESIPIGGRLEFTKSAVESLYQVLRELKEYKDLEITPKQVREMGKLYQEKCEEVARLEKENVVLKHKR